MLPRIELAGLTVSAYYLCMVLGFAAMIGLMLRRRARFSLDVPGAVLFACLIMLSGLVGCKALYLLENLQYTMENGISLGGFSLVELPIPSFSSSSIQSSY